MLLAQPFNLIDTSVTIQEEIVNVASRCHCAQRLLLPERTIWGDPYMIVCVCVFVCDFRDFTEVWQGPI